MLQPLKVFAVNINLKNNYGVKNIRKKGDLVSENDLEKSTGKQESGDYFTPVGINKEKKAYVTRLKEK